jgi:PilZ domain
VEHRWGRRFSLDIAVRLRRTAGAAINGRIINTSLSGAFVRTDCHLPPFTHVLLDLDGDAASRGQPQSIEAYVVRASREGVGLEWCEFAPPAIVGLIAHASSRRLNCRPKLPGGSGSLALPPA